MLKSPRRAYIRSARTDILLKFAFVFLTFLFQIAAIPKHLCLKRAHFATHSFFLSHFRKSAQFLGSLSVHMLKTPVRLAENSKRNDPWRFAFASSSGVISVRSYYLTSLVNLSFCGLTGVCDPFACSDALSILHLSLPRDALISRNRRGISLPACIGSILIWSLQGFTCTSVSLLCIYKIS